MNASRHAEMFRAAIAADPLAGVRMDATAIADLAFGSMSMDASVVHGGHLAMLATETLELDLSDPAQRHFGDYELQELIGEGGMGVVYRAHQASLDRDVAIKLLAAGPWASKNFIERFRREAQNAARMQHPNIVAIYEVGSSQELHFFSMRLIRGGSLADLIRTKGKLDPRDAARLLRTIAEAVDYAHKLGVLHLDLKPANVLLDDNGNPHVADFGLARRLEQGLAADTHEVSGTPSYMAPEQCLAAQKVTPATDIWGLGAILYELVTGRPPYLGASPQATLQMVVDSEPPPPREYEQAIPRDLDAIVGKCLAHDVGTRYASARELADDLGRFIDRRAVQARPLNPAQRAGRWARREPRLAVTALLALLALIAGLVATTTQWKRAETQKKVALEQTQLAKKNEATSLARLWESRRDSALRLQADGKAFEALPGLISNIEEEEKAGATTAIERREVGMILHQGVTLIDRMIIADASPLATALSPDGSLLAVGLNDISVRWYDTATLNERGRIDLLDQPTSDGTPRTPRLLRFVDNHRLLVTLDWFDYITSPANRDTILVNLDDAQVVAPPPEFADLTDAAYSADGRYALLFNRNGTGQYWQVEPWQPLSAPEYVNGSLSAIGWTVDRDGQHTISFRQSQTGIRIVAARHPHESRNIEAIADKLLVAWQESHDGTTLAVGDDNGHAWLINVKTAVAHALPLSSGSAVTWIAFSDDDAWCAVARHDGDAYAFDVASGNPLHSGSLQHDFELRHVELSHRDNLVIASGAGDVALWRMPQQGPHGGGSPAMRINANPTRSERAGIFWAGAALSAGLLATADMDGEVRLWRLPQDVDSGAHAAIRYADTLPFDGTHLVDQAYNQIRVASVDRRQATDWVTLPQPATFAELVDGGRTLVAVSGHELYAFDAKTMQPHYPPVQLPGTPNNAAIAPDSTRIVLGFGRNRTIGFELRLLAYDVATGQQRSGEAVVQGPARQMGFSADGTRLVVVGPLNGATEVFDAATLARKGVYPHPPELPVIAATFTPNADELWLAETALDESERDSGRLLRWRPQDNRVLETRSLSGHRPIGVRMLGSRPLLFTRENFVLDPGADARAGPVLRAAEVTNVSALTGDGAVLAHAYGPNVQLYDTATFEAIGPPLPVSWRYADGISRLAFAAQGERLVALLAGSRRLIVWNTPDDRRTIEDLHRDAGLLAAAPRAGRVLRIADAAERTYLRARDPGAWPAIPPRPQFVAARLIGDAAVPPRTAKTTPLQLDLTSAYSMTTTTFRSAADTVMISTYGLPLGLATLDGVDYDIRGGVELRPDRLSGGGATRAGDIQAKASGIRVPAVPIAALHVLMRASFALPEPNEREYARVRLHYRGGGEAVLSIRTQRDVPGMTGHDRPTPIGWAVNDLANMGVLPLQEFSAPRLANPHPERIVESIDLESSDEGWSEPVFLAITAEPFDPAKGKPVIADGNSGSNAVKRGVK